MVFRARWRATPEAAQATLVEIKAVDAAYPLIGAAQDRSGLGPAAKAFRRSCAEEDGAFGLLADPALRRRLKVKIGDRLVIGAATFHRSRLAGDASPIPSAASASALA